MSDSPARVGFFGGSFDPVHYGHLILAETCREQARLDRVLFVPAARSPAKTGPPAAEDKQRLEMLSLAIAGHSGFEVSTLEVDRGGTSFTVETLRELRTHRPHDEWFLIIGEDSLSTFGSWRQPNAICELAVPLVVRRPSAGSVAQAPVDLGLLRQFMTAEQFARARSDAVHSRLVDISSSDIRDRVSRNQSIRYLLPRAVEKYIESNRLYRDA